MLFVFVLLNLTIRKAVKINLTEQTNFKKTSPEYTKLKINFILFNRKYFP